MFSHFIGSAWTRCLSRIFTAGVAAACLAIPSAQAEVKPWAADFRGEQVPVSDGTVPAAPSAKPAAPAKTGK